MNARSIKYLIVLGAVAMSIFAGDALAADKKAKTAKKNKTKKVRVIKSGKSGKSGKAAKAAAAAQLEQSDNAEFCSNIKDLARESRYAMKTKELNKLKIAVDERILALEEKRAEFENWQKKREDFAAQAEATLVDIYSKMKPDAAAARLEMINTVLAASIILKLPSRKAGVILNEMKAQKAADITQIIAASSGMEKRS